MCLYILSCCYIRYDFHIKHVFGVSLSPVVCTFSFGHCVVCSSSIYEFSLPLWYLQTLLMLYLLDLYLFTHSGVQHIFCVFFVWSVFVLCLVHCVPNAASVSGLSILDCPFGFLYHLSEIAPMVSAVGRVFVLDFFVLCTICCQFLLIAHF